MNDIEQTAPTTERVDKKQGRNVFTRLKQLLIGAGETLVGIDYRGIWAGAKDFESAPWKVDMQGNMSFEGSLITDSTITGSTMTGGVVQTAETGLRLKMSGEDNAYQFLNNNTVLAELKSRTVPFSGLSGAAIQQIAGTVMLEVSGQGEGMGSRQVCMTNGAGTFSFCLIDNDIGGYYLTATGLPTTSPGGSGRIWKDGTTLRIT